MSHTAMTASAGFEIVDRLGRVWARARTIATARKRCSRLKAQYTGTCVGPLVVYQIYVSDDRGMSRIPVL